MAFDGKVGIDCSDSTDDNENIVGVLQVGECLLEQNETAEGLQEKRIPCDG